MPYHPGTHLTIAVLFGGRSGEHEVSLMSARSILAALDPARYHIIQVGITREGAWLTGENALDALEKGDTLGLRPVTLFPDPSRPGLYLLLPNGVEKLADVDVYFPVLHGTYGEDGTLQGLFELADVAYVGAGVAGSAVGMDKIIFKDVLRAQGIPVVESVTILRSEINNSLEECVRRAESVGAYPLFVKPANLGSSVGISKCRSRSDLAEGLMEAAQYDRRILVERGVNNPREIEIAVLGNERPEASIPGEIVPGADFYSYEAKYLLDSSQSLIPAPLSDEQRAILTDLALRAYTAADCAGLARVDFLLDGQSGEIFLNEINTPPGFTKISMYPKLWQASNLPYATLVNRLIELALERKKERDHTAHSYRRNS
ncbi:MAG: D-alanine--D-alanine ligase family protein [Anaerolineales bacterium]